MFKSLRLRNSILFGYSVPILLSVAVAILVYINVKTVEQKNEVMKEKYSLAYSGQGLELFASEMQRATRGYIIAEDESYVQTLEKSEKEFMSMAEMMKGQLKDTKQAGMMDNIIEKGRQLSLYSKGLIEMVRQGRQSDAAEQFKTGKATEIFRGLAGLLDEFENTENAILEEAKKTEASSLNFLTRVVWAGALLSTLLAYVIGLWVSSVISRNISGTVTAISSTSAEIASTVEQHERTASEQAASVNETTATIDELNVSSMQAVEQADTVAAMARQALTVTEEGTRMAGQASGGVANMKEKVGEIGEQILRLSEQTGQIGSIAALVTDIAGQINMLALNAAVEAVKAGEQGKGFTVIAQEVRKLADQGKKSAERVNTLVTDIQKATNSAVMVAEEGAKTVTEVAQIARKAGEAFNSLSGVATNVFESAQQVSMNLKQQSVATRQIAEAMNQINTSAKETAAGISQTKVGIQRLNDAAHNLKKMV